MASRLNFHPLILAFRSCHLTGGGTRPSIGLSSTPCLASQKWAKVLVSLGENTGKCCSRGCSPSAFSFECLMNDPHKAWKEWFVLQEGVYRRSGLLCLLFCPNISFYFQFISFFASQVCDLDIRCYHTHSLHSFKEASFSSHSLPTTFQLNNQPSK